MVTRHGAERLLALTAHSDEEERARGGLGFRVQGGFLGKVLRVVLRLFEGAFRHLSSGFGAPEFCFDQPGVRRVFV